MFTNDDELAVKLKMIANHGMKVKYYHEIVGMNSRLDNIQAAILRVKLPHLDSYCEARRAVADHYDNAFANNSKITTPYRAPYSYHVYHQYTLKLNGVNRDLVQKKLTERNIPSMIYYPVPCHKQEMFKAFGGMNFDLPVTDSLLDCVISLPIHTEMTQEELNYISENFLQVVNELS
jgi:dTDP-4-amino-4,6-dideoxygalactose transaminase